jgi:hypothetical protein
VFVILFGLLFLLGNRTGVQTLYAEIVLLCMAGVMGLSYFSLLFSSERISPVPLIIFLILNILTTVLVWMSGILESPFIILHVFLIIVSTQLYHYMYGLIQALLAFAGYIFVYGAATNHLIPYMSLLPDSSQAVLFQSPTVILIYGLLYVLLMFFTVFATSSARMMLYRPVQKVNIDTTYQEKIIQDMPMGIIVVDSDMTILGTNPWMNVHCPIAELPAQLGTYLSIEKKTDLKKIVDKLSDSLKEVSGHWHSETGDNTNLTISARLVGSHKDKYNTYVLFVELAC